MANVEKKGGFYSFTMNFEGENGDFFFDRNIIWDSGERFTFENGKANLSSAVIAGIATLRLSADILSMIRKSTIIKQN